MSADYETDDGWSVVKICDTFYISDNHGDVVAHAVTFDEAYDKLWDIKKGKRNSELPTAD